MALSEFALSELLVALNDREHGVDLVCGLAQYLARELIEIHATQAILAGRDERTDERVTERDRHRRRTSTTEAGDLELAIPKLRQGSCVPSMLELRRRIDQALYVVVMEAYMSGVSMRSMDALVESVGAASGVSKSVDRSGVGRGGDGGLHVRGVHEVDGCVGRVGGRRVGGLRVGGLPELCRSR